MNNCNFTGRITKDLTLESTGGGKNFVRFTLAVSRGKVKEGAQAADFIPCIAWNKAAEIITQYMRKGSLIEVSGRLTSRSYETQSGDKRTAYEIAVDNFGFLESRKAGQKEQTPPEPPVSEEAYTSEEAYIEEENRDMADLEDTLPFNLEGY